MANSSAASAARRSTAGIPFPLRPAGGSVFPPLPADGGLAGGPFLEPEPPMVLHMMTRAGIGPAGCCRPVGEPAVWADSQSAAGCHPALHGSACLLRPGL